MSPVSCLLSQVWYNKVMTLPRVQISAAAIKRVKNHDCWVFRDELLSAEPSIPAGELVDVTDRNGAFVARAFYNARSHIPLRIVSLRPDETDDPAWLRHRLTQAIAQRARLTHTNAKRLVFSEADQLPGLIVDQYAEYLVVQLRSAGMDRLRATLIDLLQELARPRGILERSDKAFREDEGLPSTTQILSGEVPPRIPIHEGPLQFLVDPHRGLKTGFYLDQRPTRARLLGLIEPHQRVLDAFSYTSSLGIAAAHQGARVVCVEQHEPFMDLAKEQARLNGVEDRIEWIAGDAFYWLQAQAQAHATFDWVLLDPPSLAKQKSQTTKGRQALHHLLVQALRLLAPGGSLIVSICTYHLLDVIEEIVRIASAEVGVRLTVRDRWLQAEDHPWILHAPATRYLTSWRFATSPSHARDAR